MTHAENFLLWLFAAVMVAVLVYGLDAVINFVIHHMAA